MKYQEFMITATKKTADEAFRYALAVPEDKADWRPLDEGRSVLDQAREMAKAPIWAIAIISGDKMPEFNEETQAQHKAEMEQMKSVAEAKEECDKNLEALFEVFRSLPDEKLEETKWLPFDGGRDFTVKEMMYYPHWNFTYHLGQIAYIQTLYGDKDMH